MGSFAMKFLFRLGVQHPLARSPLLAKHLEDIGWLVALCATVPQADDLILYRGVE